MKRGEIWWAPLGEPAGSEPGHPRPVVIVSSNGLNDSTLPTVLALPITTQLSRANYAGNVRLPGSRKTGLRETSVAVVNQVMTVNRLVLKECIGRVPDDLMRDIDQGLRLVLAL